MSGWAAFAQIADKAMDVGGQIYGQRTSAKYARQMQLRDQRWREHMRRTNYQAATEDLEKAGLNRILALGGPGQAPGSSGGSGPGGISPSPTDWSAVAHNRQLARKARYEADILQPAARAANTLADVVDEGMDFVDGNENPNSAKGESILRKPREKVTDALEFLFGPGGFLDTARSGREVSPFKGGKDNPVTNDPSSRMHKDQVDFFMSLDLKGNLRQRMEKWREWSKERKLKSVQRWERETGKKMIYSFGR